MTDKTCPICGDSSQWNFGFVWHKLVVHYKARFRAWDWRQNGFGDRVEILSWIGKRG